jgi:hypothetical protein
MQLAPSAAIAASVSLRRLMDQWGVWPASPTPLTRFIGLAPLLRMHARPTYRIKSKGWDGSVRGKIAKGHFVQGMQHPRIFGREHIGRGWTNIAPFACSAIRYISFKLTTPRKQQTRLRKVHTANEGPLRIRFMYSQK